jgi:hypothetical protein
MVFLELENSNACFLLDFGVFMCRDSDAMVFARAYYAEKVRFSRPEVHWISKALFYGSTRGRKNIRPLVVM